MDKAAILSYLGDDWVRTESLIRSSLRSDIDLLNDTNASLLEHSGKKLRPMLSLLMAKACGDGHVTDDSIRYAAAAELLHNATLLHDDVADGSAERRGMPTVASLLGNTPSVLIGDFWLVKAMETIISSDSNDDEVTRLFSRTLSDLAEGEMFQLQKAASGDTSEEDYLRVIKSKTASLFEAACVSAAISVGASEEVKDMAREYAFNLGLAFQIKDDILDYEGGEIGKPSGMDLRERKITLPLLGALAEVGAAEQDRVRYMVTCMEDDPANIGRVMSFVREHGGLDYARARLHHYSLSAIKALGGLPESEARNMLAELAEFTESRDK